MPKLALAKANTIISPAFVKAQEIKVKPLAVVVSDDSGHII